MPLAHLLPAIKTFSASSHSKARVQPLGHSWQIKFSITPFVIVTRTLCKHAIDLIGNGNPISAFILLQPLTACFSNAAIFFALGSFLIFISRRIASLLSILALVTNNFTGLRERVYFAATPLLWAAKRLSILLVMPVYRLSSEQRKIYTTHTLLFCLAFMFMI